MTISGISTYSIFQSSLNDIGQTQVRLSDAQNQLSSGRKSDDFAGIATRAAELLSVDAQIARGERFIINNTITISKLDGTNVALSRVIDTASELKNLISLQRTGAGNLDFIGQLRSQWQAITAALNSNVNGQYLFSGTATDTPAVNTDDFPSLEESGTPDDGYYQGSQQNIMTRSQDGVEFVSNIRADDPSIQKIFAGLAMAQEGSVKKSDDILRQAFDMVSEGLEGVIALQSQVNANTVKLKETNTFITNTKIYLKGIQEEIGNADLISLSTKVAVDQGILQASFQAFARINSLKLSDYLQ